MFREIREIKKEEKISNGHIDITKRIGTGTNESNGNENKTEKVIDITKRVAWN